MTATQPSTPSDSSGEELAAYYDVVCVGGAMTGSSVAYFLTQCADFDGRVLVVEPDWTYERAMSTRAQNSIREQFTNRTNIEISQFGMQFMADFAGRVAVNGDAPDINFRGTGYLFLADTEADYQRLADEAEAQLSMGAHVEMLRPAQLAKRYPYLDTDVVAGARAGSLREGSFDGWALFQGLRTRAIHDGAHYLRDSVIGLDMSGSHVTAVRLASGRRVECGVVINAAGCRAPVIAAMAGIELPVEPRSRTSFVFDCRTPIDVTVPLTVTGAGVHFRREQHHYMCGTVPVDDVAVSPDDLDARVDEFEELIWPVLAHHIPQFDQVGVVTSWGGQYDYNTLDQNLIIGPTSVVEGFLCANGFSGHGLQQGPGVGRGLAEWIVYGEYRSIDLSPLGYDRIERNEPLREHAVI